MKARNSMLVVKALLPILAAFSLTSWRARLRPDAMRTVFFLEAGMVFVLRVGKLAIIAQPRPEDKGVSDPGVEYRLIIGPFESMGPCA